MNAQTPALLVLCVFAFGLGKVMVGYVVDRIHAWWADQ